MFEFLDIPSKHSEKTLQQALVTSLKDFILELGHEALPLWGKSIVCK
ncbi:MAG: hypothetical protein U9N49_06125 [Campylobacterota bacterium]|nr:hypothetical protein [Campylobacterota bacterium]